MNTYMQDSVLQAHLAYLPTALALSSSAATTTHSAPAAFAPWQDGANQPGLHAIRLALYSCESCRQELQYATSVIK